MPFTLRQIQMMAEGKAEYERSLQADFMALVYNCHSRKPIKPSEIYQTSRNFISAEEMRDLIQRK